MVPVLPVVTKADTMTARERINFRADLNQRLLHPHRDSDEAINLFQFSEDTLAACGITDSNMVHTASMPPPYLVVCSNVVNQDRLTGDEPQFWPERNYDWGTCEAFNTGHSDLLLLRRLLLQEGVAEIAKGKVERCAPVWSSPCLGGGGGGGGSLILPVATRCVCLGQRVQRGRAAWCCPELGWVNRRWR